MPATRLSERDHARVRRLAEQTGTSQRDVLSRAIDIFEREHFFALMDSGYASLHDDSRALSQEMEERAAWDATLADTGADE